MEGRSRRCLYTLAHAEAERYRRERQGAGSSDLATGASSEAAPRLEARSGVTSSRAHAGRAESATAEAVADRDECCVDDETAATGTPLTEPELRSESLATEAVHEWNRLHWWPWAAERYLEHVCGETFWRQFAEHDFDVLATATASSRMPERSTFTEVVRRLRDLIDSIRARGTSVLDAEVVRRLEREIESLTRAGETNQMAGDRDHAPGRSGSTEARMDVRRSG